MATEVTSIIRARSVNRSRRLMDKYGYRIKSPLLNGDVGFVTFSEMKMTTETIKYRAGGSLLPSKSPGLSDFDPVTATRGATTKNDELLNWKLKVTSPTKGAQSIGTPLGRGSCNSYKSHIYVVLTSRCHTCIKRWMLQGAFPTEFSGIDGLDANASDHIFESMTWEYDYFEIVGCEDGVKAELTVGGNELYGVNASTETGLNFDSQLLGVTRA